MLTKSKNALIPVAVIAAGLPSIANAQATDAVSTQLAGANITSWLTSGQGLIVGALILVVGFVMFRRAFR